MIKPYLLISDIGGTFTGIDEHYEKFEKTVLNLEKTIQRPVILCFVTGSSVEGFEWFINNDLQEAAPELRKRVSMSFINDQIFTIEEIEKIIKENRGIDYRKSSKILDKSVHIYELLKEYGIHSISGYSYIGDGDIDSKAMSILKNSSSTSGDNFDLGANFILVRDFESQLSHKQYSVADYTSSEFGLEGCSECIAKLTQKLANLALE